MDGLQIDIWQMVRGGRIDGWHSFTKVAMISPNLTAAVWS
jgi:hypothetical protein